MSPMDNGETTIFSYFYILKFVNKNLVAICWKTNLLCKCLHYINILDFASWPAWPKIFTL